MTIDLTSETSQKWQKLYVTKYLYKHISRYVKMSRSIDGGGSFMSWLGSSVPRGSTTGNINVGIG